MSNATRNILSTIIVFFIMTMVCSASYIVFDSGDNEKMQAKLNTFVVGTEKDTYIKSLPKIYSQDLKVVKSGDRYFLVQGPLPDDRGFAAYYFHIKKSHPNAFVISEIGAFTPKSKNRYEPPVVNFPVSQSQIPQNEDDITFWIALFGLAIIGILALYLSSHNIQRLKEEHNKIKKKHAEIEQQQHKMFTDLGESIYNMSKDVVECTQDVISEVEGSGIDHKLRRVVNTENKILDTTSNLLGFLKLKAKKVEIKTSSFNINNVLDDVAGSLVTKVSNNDIELIFNMERSLPKRVIGDFVHIGEILINLLENSIKQSAKGEVILDLSAFRNYKDNLELQFKITFFTIENEPLENYFVPYYDSESGRYRRLGLFVSSELTKLMGGELTIQRAGDSNEHTINLTIPVLQDPDEQMRKYPLPSKEYTQKDVLIVNRNYNASLAIKKMFAYFKHKVKVIEAAKFEDSNPDFSDFDIVVIEESLIDDYLQVHIETVRKSNGVKVVGVRNIFDSYTSSVDKNILDRRMSKPFNQEKVYTLIMSLYEDMDASLAAGLGATDREFRKKEAKARAATGFMSDIKETPRISLKNFTEFSGSKIMVVEDNEINRRMLMKVLERSGIEIVSTENGEEAVEYMKSVQPGEIELILMDINMPIMDGYAATIKIRKIDGLEDIPIVALSALTLDNEIERMIESGLDGFLPKPLNIGQLYTVFDKFLKKVDISSKTISRKKTINIDELEGIDVKTGLQHTGGNELVFKEILEEFLDVYGDSDRLINKLYEQKRLAQLKQLLLDLMGIAGTIGANGLYLSTNEIYKMYIYNKMSLIPDYTKQYSTELKKMKGSIMKYLGRK